VEVVDVVDVERTGDSNHIPMSSCCGEPGLELARLHWGIAIGRMTKPIEAILSSTPSTSGRPAASAQLLPQNPQQ
jgi:hypothetical protein